MTLPHLSPKSAWPLAVTLATLLPSLGVAPAAQASDLRHHREVTEAALRQMGWQDGDAIALVAEYSLATDLGRIPRSTCVALRIHLPEEVDRVAELCALAETGHGRVEVRVGDGSLGVPDRVPFDAIAVAAATPVVPQALYDQLVGGGRMVLPLGGSRGQLLTRVVRTDEGPKHEAVIGCRFVPLVDA